MPRKDSTTSSQKKLAEENRRLKAENARLKQQTVQKKPRNISFGNIVRKIGVVFFLALAVALLVAGNVLFWAGHTIVNTDSFISTTEPLIKNPTIQNDVALYTTNQIFDNVDVEGYIDQVLPERASFLAPQLSAQLKSGTQTVLKQALANPKFQDVWIQTMRNVHESFINYVSNYKGTGAISLNDVYSQLSKKLEGTNLSFLANKQLPAKVGSITIVNASWLPTAHKIVTHINTWRIMTIIGILVFLGLAIWLARKRRKIVYAFGWATAIAMFLTLISIRLAPQTFANKAQPEYSGGVKEAVKTVLNPLRTQTITILVAALIIVVIAWLSGGSKSAQKTKGFIQKLFSGKLHQAIFGSRQNKFLLWMQKYRRVVEWVIVAAGALIVLIVNITLTSLLVYLLVVALLVVIVEIIGHKE